MSTSADNQFVVTWVIENFSCCVLKKHEYLDSPCFIIKMPVSTKWILSICPKGTDGSDYIEFYLEGKKPVNEGIDVGYEFQILNKEGFVVDCVKTNHTFSEAEACWGFSNFLALIDIFDEGKNLLPMDTLTLRAKIWKTDGSLPDTTHCFIKTRMHKENVSSILSINKFSSITTGMKKIVWEPEVSEETPKLKVSFSLEGGTTRSEYLCFEVEVEDSQEYILLIAAFSLLNINDEKVETKEDEIRLDSDNNPKVLKLPCFLLKEVLTKKGYLKNDCIRFHIKFLLLKGIEYESIESSISGPQILLDSKHFSEIMPIKIDDKETKSLNDLNHDLQTMRIDQLLNDVTLKVGSQSFPAHRLILSARSPVFRAMFTSDMKESVEGVVQVLDIDGETVQNLLCFIYTDVIKNLDIETAKKLYVAADKYQVLLLKKKCCDYLMENLSICNMCDMITLADIHHDDSFKSSVMTYIVDNYQDILETDTWISFMKHNLSLAAEVMYQTLSTLKN